MSNKKSVWVVFYFFVLALWVVFFTYVLITNYKKVSFYNGKIFYNTYLDEYNISKSDIDKLDDIVNLYSEKFLSKNVKFIINNKEYLYKYSDLGLSVDKEKLKKDILNYQDNLNYMEKINILRKNSKKVFSFNFTYNKDDIKNFLNNLKNDVDVSVTNGHFVVNDNREVSYVLGTDSFSLNVDKSVEEIISNINEKDTIKLLGDSEIAAVNNESYKLVDTKVSSFSTEFDPYISRATNLKTALNYIDGAIIEPGEVFSFYKYAGPYNKKGYVFYYEFVGNGVCQIATTVYNAALLGGLEIVKRYPHAKKSVYVDGGLDATVASYAGGWNVDFQFKNTYKYPIYVSAYAIDGKAYVDFWSNSNAKEGKSYTTESVKLGSRYYKTYLHTFQNGVEIDKSLIASTWYTEE